MSWFSKYKTYHYPNGDKYTGPIDEYGLRKGTGTYIESNGSKYVGDFLDDYQHGTGTYTFPNGDRYVGEWNNGDRHGHGCSTFGDAKHTGEYKFNLRNGYGIYETENGKKYSGNFVNGEMEGEGVFTELNSQGDRITYTGSYKKGKKNGYGVLVGEDGYKYSGEWKDGHKHGKGILEIPAKDNKTGKYYEKPIKYEGSFVKDKKEGFGILSYPLGFRYEGMFQNNERNGQGKALYPSGEYDEGIYKEGKNWNVTEFSKNGNIEAVYIDGVKDDNYKREIKEELKVKEELPSSIIGKTFNFTSNKGLYEAAKILGIKILEDQDYKLYYSTPHPMGEDIKPLMTDGNNNWYLDSTTISIGDLKKDPEHSLFIGHPIFPDEVNDHIVLKVKLINEKFIKILSFNADGVLIEDFFIDLITGEHSENNYENKINNEVKKYTLTEDPKLIEAGRLMGYKIFTYGKNAFFSSSAYTTDLKFKYIRVIKRVLMISETCMAKIIRLDSSNIKQESEYFKCKCEIDGFVVEAQSGTINQSSYINPNGLLIETHSHATAGDDEYWFNHKNSEIHHKDSEKIIIKKDISNNSKSIDTSMLVDGKMIKGPLTDMPDLKSVVTGPLWEIGKILETDFYDDKDKNLYYRDFPGSLKYSERLIYPFDIQDRDFWSIKDGYTVNLSIVNWMDYKKMREGPHNEAKLPNLYVTLSTPNKVFDMVFNIDGKLISNQD